jgi:hypothetical protein
MSVFFILNGMDGNIESLLVKQHFETKGTNVQDAIVLAPYTVFI